MRTRLAFLIMTITVAVVVVACGRATQTEIDSALGITPTATFSAAQISTSTAVAIAEATGRAAAIAAIASPGSGNDANVNLAAAGDVTQGRTQFTIRCQQCHQPSGTGRAPALKGPDNPAVALTDAQLRDMLRTGEGHAVPPGPITAVTISDRQLINIIAFIRNQAE